MAPFLKDSGNRNSGKPEIIPRDQHNVSRDEISKSALKVLYRLHKSGYQAFLVGGCIRDALIGLHPKDFDVATNATPDEVRALFSNCRLIGRRFRLAHVRFGREIIAVATFRADASHAHDDVEPRAGRVVAALDIGHGDRSAHAGAVAGGTDRADLPALPIQHSLALTHRPFAIHRQSHPSQGCASGHALEYHVGPGKTPGALTIRPTGLADRPQQASLHRVDIGRQLVPVEAQAGLQPQGVTRTQADRLYRFPASTGIS